MTVESLMNTFTQYVSWLFSERQWARWELLTIGLTAMFLLLFVLVSRRRAKAGRARAKQVLAKASTIGTNLDAGMKTNQQIKSGSGISSLISIPNGNGSRKGWKQTTKKWKDLQKLVEQLHEETAKYKQAEELLAQQFARLKEAHEQLGRKITGGEQVIQVSESEPESEINRPRIINDFSRQPGRTINSAGVHAKDS